MTVSISRAMTLRRTKSGIVKDGSEQPDGQEVLDEHLFNGGLGEVRVECLTAFLVEIVKGGGKLWIRFLRLCDDFFPTPFRFLALDL